MTRATTAGARVRPTDSLDPAQDTFPKLVVDNATRLADKVAIREKHLGIWQAHSWTQYLAESRLIALGLAALGFARGDRKAGIGDNRPPLYWDMLVTQALGRVPDSRFQDAIGNSV